VGPQRGSQKEEGGGEDSEKIDKKKAWDGRKKGFKKRETLMAMGKKWLEGVKRGGGCQHEEVGWKRAHKVLKTPRGAVRQLSKGFGKRLQGGDQRCTPGKAG